MEFHIDPDFVRIKDDDLLKQDIPLHARPFHVLIMWMDENKIQANLGDKNLTKQIHEIYEKLYPHNPPYLPPFFVGGVVIKGLVRFVNVNKVLGTAAINPIDCIEIDKNELQDVFKYTPDVGWEAFYCACDAWDLAYGITHLSKYDDSIKNLMSNARSSVSSSMRILSTYNDEVASVQTSHLGAELSIKAILACLGTTDKEIKQLSHNLSKLCDCLIKKKPSQTDEILKKVCSSFPNYVTSRYSKNSLTRNQVLALSLKSQFVAADVVRRMSDANMMEYFENLECYYKRPYMYF